VITVHGKVGDIHVVAMGKTREVAECDLRVAQAAVRTNRPMLGWLARPKGDVGAGKQIVQIDKEAGTVKLSDEAMARRWADCEYVW
jgi:hypothetical protein